MAESYAQENTDLTVNDVVKADNLMVQMSIWYPGSSRAQQRQDLAELLLGLQSQGAVGLLQRDGSDHETTARQSGYQLMKRENDAEVRSA